MVSVRGGERWKNEAPSTKADPPFLHSKKRTPQSWQGPYLLGAYWPGLHTMTQSSTPVASLTTVEKPSSQETRSSRGPSKGDERGGDGME